MLLDIDEISGARYRQSGTLIINKMIISLLPVGMIGSKESVVTQNGEFSQRFALTLNQYVTVIKFMIVTYR